MKIAIPTVNDKLCVHFGHCEVFTFFEINEETKEITGKTTVVPPVHQPGILPPWVAEQGASIVIAGGMGARAQALFNQEGINVIVGAESKPTEEIVKDYLAGTLATGINACDH
jgi:predicted Fe-Mo cluster-binding NifX family protein